MKRNVVPIFVLLLILTCHSVNAQMVQRPSVWGIAKITFLVSDFQLARNYYGDFLGFDEAFSYSSDLGKIISFKVSDRQFLEFISDHKAREKKRLVSVSLETDNAEQMRQYFKSKGYVTPDKTTIDGAGNEVFVVNDSSGNQIEFIEYKPNGLHKQSHGKFLSERRISNRIHHVGVFANRMDDNDPFYTGILGCNEIVRYPEDKNLPATILYLQFPECLENVEHYYPNDENVSHPCFLVDDMQETLYTLKERNRNEIIGKPVIGRGKRWIMNMYNSDKTRIEFTEAHCVK